MRFLGSVSASRHVDVRQSISGAFKIYHDFPPNPKIGTWAFIHKSLMLCISEGDRPKWVSLTQERNTYIYTQSTPADQWVIMHGFESKDVLVQCFDLGGNVVVPSKISRIDVNATIVEFEDKVSGKAVILYGKEEDVSASGQMRGTENYKVGSCYITTLSINPFDVLGYGKWELISSDIGATLEFGDGSVCSLNEEGSNSVDVPLVEHTHTATFKGNALPNHGTSFNRPRGNENNKNGHGTSWWGQSNNQTTFTDSVSGGTPSGSVSVSPAGSRNAKLNVKGKSIRINIWVRKEDDRES